MIHPLDVHSPSAYVRGVLISQLRNVTELRQQPWADPNDIIFEEGKVNAYYDIYRDFAHHERVEAQNLDELEAESNKLVR